MKESSDQSEKVVSQEYPADDRVIGRDELMEIIETRFQGEFEPTIVIWDETEKWHYPLTAHETLCGKDIPGEVHAAKSSELYTHSGAVCRGCGGIYKRVNKQDLHSLIASVVGFDNSGGTYFKKHELIKILEYVERAERPARKSYYAANQGECHE